MSRRTALIATAALALGSGLAVLPTQAQAATVVVSNVTDLSNAVKNATPGTVIQVRGGTYRPTATLSRADIFSRHSLCASHASQFPHSQSGSTSSPKCSRM